MFNRAMVGGGDGGHSLGDTIVLGICYAEDGVARITVTGLKCCQ